MHVGTQYTTRGTTSPIVIEDIEGFELADRVGAFITETVARARSQGEEREGNDWSQALVISSSHSIVPLGDGRYHFIVSVHLLRLTQ